MNALESRAAALAAFRDGDSGNTALEGCVRAGVYGMAGFVRMAPAPEQETQGRIQGDASPPPYPVSDKWLESKEAYMPDTHIHTSEPPRDHRRPIDLSVSSFAGVCSSR